MPNETNTQLTTAERAFAHRRGLTDEDLALASEDVTVCLVTGNVAHRAGAAAGRHEATSSPGHDAAAAELELAQRLGLSEQDLALAESNWSVCAGTGRLRTSRF